MISEHTDLLRSSAAPRLIDRTLHVNEPPASMTSCVYFVRVTRLHPRPLAASIAVLICTELGYDTGAIESADRVNQL